MRLRNYLTLLVLFVSGSITIAQNYQAGLISDSLLHHADLVMREFTREFEVTGVGSATEKVTRVMTVLNKDGDDNAVLIIPYDKDSKITIHNISIYNRSGKKVKTAKQSEVADIPAFDGASLYSDNRLMIFRPDYAEYPYTVEYNYEIKSANLISYGSWSPVQGYNISSEHSKFVISGPENIPYQKKELNLITESKIVKTGNKASETWEYKGFRALESEPYSISFREICPRVFLMPVNINYDKYPGKTDTWKSYGDWVYSLYNGRDELSENEKPVIRSLIQGTHDTIKIIEILYKYLQNRTRYVGIQLGIGSFQPFTAKTVFEEGYGDCKALTNYMHTLLRETGIKSYPALVSSGTYIEPIFTDFPNFQQFDHVILCVPFSRDTIWLECTNQTIPFSFLGDFTDNRKVLLITEKGGTFARTRSYSADDNLRSCKTILKIDPEGTASGSISYVFNCLRYGHISQMLNNNNTEQKKWLYNYLSLPSVKIDGFTITRNDSPKPSARIELSVVSGNFCSFTGNYMIIPVNRINYESALKKSVEERRSDVVISRSVCDLDTVLYQIPAGYKIEALPSGKKISSMFGEYSCSIKLDNSNILYIRSLRLNQGTYKAKDYTNLYNFFLSVSKADGEKILLVKN